MKTELELRHLRVFVTVVEAGAHTRAARTLGLSQSTVSETLSALERTLGIPLFRKTAKGVTLTSPGEVLLAYARRILALTGEAIDELARSSSSVTGTLVVAAVESRSAYVLPSRLAALRERWPNARVEVITGVCAEIRERVASGKCDLGLLLEADNLTDSASVLARSRFVIFGHPSHPLAGERRASPDRLRRCDFYMGDTAGSYHQMLRQYFEAAEVPHPRTQAMGTTEGVKRGILEGGLALGLLPSHAVQQELADGVLAEISPSPALPPLVMRELRSPGDASSPLVDDLIESLRDALP